MPAEERYKTDPIFHALVNQIYNAIELKQYTPTEVREASILASLMWEERNPGLVISGYPGSFPDKKEP
ncbi:MAG: hypothetical protein V3T30_04860 [Thermodesulfobacteriota bacterium]